MFIMDGVKYDVVIEKQNISSELTYKFKKMLDNGTMKCEPKAVYYNQSLTFGMGKKTDDFILLWDKLNQPSEGHVIKIPIPTGEIELNVTCDNVEIERIKTRQGVYWTSLSVNFTATNPSRSY